MYASLQYLNQSLKTAFSSRDRQDYTDAQKRLDVFRNFWFLVEGLATPIANAPAGDQRSRMRAFFETEDIDDSDVEFLSKYMLDLADEAKTSSDADEGVWIMKDFFHLQEGRSLTRTVRLDCTGSISPRFVFDEPLYIEDDCIEHDDCSWLNSLTPALEADCGLLMLYSVKTPYETLSNLQQSLLYLLMQSGRLRVTEGLYKSIMMPIEFVKDRDNRKLFHHKMTRATLK